MHKKIYIYMYRVNPAASIKLQRSNIDCKVRLGLGL